MDRSEARARQWSTRLIVFVWICSNVFDSWKLTVKSDDWAQLVHHSMCDIILATQRPMQTPLVHLMAGVLLACGPAVAHLVALLPHLASAFVLRSLLSNLGTPFRFASAATMLFVVWGADTTHYLWLTSLSITTALLTTLVAVWCFECSLRSSRAKHRLWLGLSIASTVATALLYEVGVVLVPVLTGVLAIREAIRRKGPDDSNARVIARASLGVGPIVTVVIGYALFVRHVNAAGRHFHIHALSEYAGDWHMVWVGVRALVPATMRMLIPTDRLPSTELLQARSIVPLFVGASGAALAVLHTRLVSSPDETRELSRGVAPLALLATLAGLMPFLFSGPGFGTLAYTPFPASDCSRAFYFAGVGASVFVAALLDSRALRACSIPLAQGVFVAAVFWAVFGHGVARAQWLGFQWRRARVVRDIYAQCPAVPERTEIVLAPGLVHDPIEHVAWWEVSGALGPLYGPTRSIWSDEWPADVRQGDRSGKVRVVQGPDGSPFIADKSLCRPIAESVADPLTKRLTGIETR